MRSPPDRMCHTPADSVARTELAMASSSLTLPVFEDPPLVETILSVQFESLKKVRLVHLGLLWERYKERFPHTTELPHLNPTTEQFRGSEDPERVIQIELNDAPPLPRICFANPSYDQTIQVQDNRFAKN